MRITWATEPERRAPKLLTQVRQAIRLHQYNRRTEEAYVGWVRRYVRFSGLRHPAELGSDDVRRFLTDLADTGRVSASTQTQALSALSGTPRLVAMLMYGSGLRLLEALQVRVKDLDFVTGEVVVRRGKGGKERITMLADSVRQELETHLARVRRQHQRDLAAGGGYAPLPGAFHRRSPGAGREWGWQYVFPATRRYLDRGIGLWCRHHLHESVIQRAVKRGRSGLSWLRLRERQCLPWHRGSLLIVRQRRRVMRDLDGSDCMDYRAFDAIS